MSTAPYGTWEAWHERVQRLEEEHPGQYIGEFGVFCPNHDPGWCEDCEPFISEWEWRHGVQSEGRSGLAVGARIAAGYHAVQEMLSPSGGRLLDGRTWDEMPQAGAE